MGAHDQKKSWVPQASLLHSPFLLPPLLVLSFEAAILPLSVGTAQDFWDLEPQYSLHHRQILAFTIISSSLLAVPCSYLAWFSVETREKLRMFSCGKQRTSNSATPCGKGVDLKDFELGATLLWHLDKAVLLKLLEHCPFTCHSSSIYGVFHNLRIYWELQVTSVSSYP